MSCWVVPTIAAELWGIPVEQILQRIDAGHIPTKNELGRMFVDVAPNSPKIETPKSLRPPTPATFSVVTAEEAAALAGIGGDIDGDDQSIDLGDWRKARELSEKRRKPPIAA